MPTFARLVAALLLAGLGFGVAQLVPPYFPEGMALGMVAPVAAGAGLLVGWAFLGRRLGRHSGAAVSLGLTASISQTLLTLLVFAGDKVLERALRRTYENITDAVVGLFEAGVEYGEKLAQPDIIVAILLGGVIAGAITSWVARRTR